MSKVVIAAAFTGLVITGIVGLALARRCLHVVPEGEAHVVQRFGRFRTVRKPGVRLRLPMFERVSRVPIRPFGLPLTAVATTRDGRRVRVAGAIEAMVVDPLRFVIHHAALQTVVLSLISSVTAQVAAEHDSSAPAELTVPLRHELDLALRRYGIGVREIAVRSITPDERFPAVSIAAA